MENTASPENTSKTNALENICVGNKEKNFFGNCSTAENTNSDDCNCQHDSQAERSSSRRSISNTSRASRTSRTSRSSRRSTRLGSIAGSIASSFGSTLRRSLRHSIGCISLTGNAIAERVRNLASSKGGSKYDGSESDDKVKARRTAIFHDCENNALNGNHEEKNTNPLVPDMEPEAVAVTFSFGNHGLVLCSNSPTNSKPANFVSDVVHKSQACYGGVKVGWEIVNIDGEIVNENNVQSLLFRKSRAGKKYTVVFCKSRTDTMWERALKKVYYPSLDRAI